MYVLQNLVLPGLEFGAPVEMYVRLLDKGASASLATRKLRLKAGSQASFDTYFNGLTVQTWKASGGIETLALRLVGQGEVIVRLGLHQLGASPRWLAEERMDLAGKPLLQVGMWSQLQSGILFVSVTALTPVELAGGTFETETAPAQQVKLGLVITHFNREASVVPAIRRISDGILSDPAFDDRIGLVVVDNSRTLSGHRTDGATVLPNPNLGGSGGFTRGLMFLEDEGSFTHCLFMDDDASCELESIRRCHALLSYATVPRLAVAGSLLRERKPAKLFEKGAKFDGQCRPLKSDLDMVRIRDLLKAEVDEVVDYGGWWFFAFPIKQVKAYAFPFFVRGDDVFFSLMNRFHITTANGIGCWAEDFGFKHGPSTAYLDTRYHLLASMVLLDEGRLQTAVLYFKFFIRALLSHNYASAQAITMALDNVAEGPGFWTENVDMQVVRQRIGAIAGPEKMLPMTAAGVTLPRRRRRESGARWLLRMSTLNGFLLPGFLLNDTPLHQKKSFYGSLRKIFGYRTVYYRDQTSGTGYVAVHDKRRAFAVGSRSFAVLMRFLARYSRLSREYRLALPALTSRSFWEGLYRVSPGKAAAAADHTAATASAEKS